MYQSSINLLLGGCGWGTKIWKYLYPPPPPFRPTPTLIYSRGYKFNLKCMFSCLFTYPSKQNRRSKVGTLRPNTQNTTKMSQNNPQKVMKSAILGGVGGGQIFRNICAPTTPHKYSQGYKFNLRCLFCCSFISHLS